MLIGFLFIAFLTIWGNAFVLFERDIFCPTMLFLSGYTISVGVVFFSDFIIPFDFHTQTVYVLLVGTFLFCIPAYAIKTLYAGSEGVRAITLSRTDILIRPFALWVYAFFLSTIIFLTFYVYLDILLPFNPNITLVGSVDAMRNHIIFNPDGVMIPEFFILNQVKRFFRIAGYFLLLVWARNSIIHRSFLHDKLLLLNLFLTIILFFTDGGRGSIVAYVLAGLGLLFIFDRLYNHTCITLSVGLVIKLICGFFVACVIFYVMLYISGRKTGAFQLTSFIHHIRFYLAGSIPLLDNFLLTSLVSGTRGITLFGNETFYSLVQLLSKLHIVNISLYDVNLEFRPGVYDGNVYTAFRSYLHDFGYAGLIFMPILFSICANWLYYAALKTSKEKAVAVGLVLYATLMYPIFADFVRCFFCLSFFSLNTICLCIGVMLLQWFLLKTGLMRFRECSNWQSIDHESNKNQ